MSDSDKLLASIIATWRDLAIITACVVWLVEKL